jgi:hypothetical protein
MNQAVAVIGATSPGNPKEVGGVCERVALAHQDEQRSLRPGKRFGDRIQDLVRFHDRSVDRRLRFGDHLEREALTVTVLLPSSSESQNEIPSDGSDPRRGAC